MTSTCPLADDDLREDLTESIVGDPSAPAVLTGLCLLYSLKHHEPDKLESTGYHRQTAVVGNSRERCPS